MTSWYESRIDRQIREAAERGQFDNLPGAGKPLPDRNELHDEDWWLKALLEREKIDGRTLLPPLLALRRECDDLGRRPGQAPHRGVGALGRWTSSTAGSGSPGCCRRRGR